MSLNHLRNNGRNNHHIFLSKKNIDADYFPITDEIKEPSFEQAKWIFS